MTPLLSEHDDRRRKAVALLPGLGAIEAVMGHRFTDPMLLVTAFTHASYRNEHRGAEDNQRLEFLGDAVLGFIVADLVSRARPDATEGALTRIRASLVSEPSLADTMRGLHVAEHVRVGKSAMRQAGAEKSSVLADLFEAALAAIYLDAGLDAARAFVEQLLEPSSRALDEDLAHRDAKTRLQELLQARYQCTPNYRTVAEEGPPEAPRFRVEVSLPPVPMLGGFEGSGGTKKEAERQAASRAFDALVAYLAEETGSGLDAQAGEG